MSISFLVAYRPHRNSLLSLENQKCGRKGNYQQLRKQIKHFCLVPHLMLGIHSQRSRFQLNGGAAARNTKPSQQMEAVVLVTAALTALIIYYYLFSNGRRFNEGKDLTLPGEFAVDWIVTTDYNQYPYHWEKKLLWESRSHTLLQIIINLRRWLLGTLAWRVPWKKNSVHWQKCFCLTKKSPCNGPAAFGRFPTLRSGFSGERGLGVGSFSRLGRQESHNQQVEVN